MLVHLTRVSDNLKTGPIPVTTSSKDSCPSSCAFRGNGCYAENFPLSLHWQKVTDGRRGMAWVDFVDEVRRSKEGQVWRHNQAGDLAGENDTIDAPKLRELAAANKGRRGFTYTHYPLTKENVKAIRAANAKGLTINVSTDSLADADAKAQHGLPLVTVVPPGWKGKTTPGGLPVTVCPAQRIDIDCATCALCQKADRRAVVAFEAHGARRRTVINIINIIKEVT